MVLLNAASLQCNIHGFKIVPNISLFTYSQKEDLELSKFYFKRSILVYSFLE